MHAIIQARYGSPDELVYAETPIPAPKEDEVLVKIHAAAVNRGDIYMLRGQPFFVRFGSGLRRPKSKIPGADMAGVVEAVGKGVSDFRPGDAVFGDLSAHGRGAFADYVAARAAPLAAIPPGVSFADAAAAPMAGVTALQGLRTHGALAPGDRVLINGASGGVGTFAVQIAKALGAHVTAVCSTQKAAMVRELGADRVIDYKQEDFVQEDVRYNLIFDTVANRTVAEYRAALTPAGRFVTTGFLPTLALPFGKAKGQSMKNMLAHPNRTDLAFLATLMADGAVRPVIDRTYPPAEIPAALRYLDQGHAAGKVVILVTDEGFSQPGAISALTNQPVHATVMTDLTIPRSDVREPKTG